MPPQEPMTDKNIAKAADSITDNSQPQRKSGGAGPIIGVIIIVVLLIIGALYFWGAHLSTKNSQEQLPLIPASSGTTTVQQ